jgi:Ca2+-binding EF-hand superfamily protein
MSRKWKLILLISFIGGSILSGFGQTDKGSRPRKNSLTLGEAQVKQLLLLMDTDKNGKISKKEYMTFMEAEFDRLDKDKSGELDPNELGQSKLQAAPFSLVGK